jgi:hypothetical protein
VQQPTDCWKQDRTCLFGDGFDEVELGFGFYIEGHNSRLYACGWCQRRKEAGRESEKTHTKRRTILRHDAGTKSRKRMRRF